MPFVGSIFASTLSGGIGIRGKLPWRISEDLKHFERTTVGFDPTNQKAVIMGRRTYESLPAPLKRRVSFVITSKDNLKHSDSQDVVLCKSLAEALAKMNEMNIEVGFITGGASLYNEVHAKGLPDRVYWTRVCGPKIVTDTTVDLDLLLKHYDIVEMTKTKANEKYTYDFVLLERKSSAAGSATPGVKSKTNRDENCDDEQQTIQSQYDRPLSPDAGSLSNPTRRQQPLPGVMDENVRDTPQLNVEDGAQTEETCTEVVLPPTLASAEIAAAQERSSTVHVPLNSLPPALQKLRYVGHQEAQYLSIMHDIIENGLESDDRTGVGTYSKFGVMMRYDLRESFPLLTTKKVYWKGVVEELLWFLKGDTNAKNLADKNVHVWDANGSKDFLEKRGLGHREEGDLGPVYGFQWRHFGADYKDCHTNYEGKGFDQVLDVINQIKHDPTSRRLIISAWNPAALHEMALPPCHMMAQFFVDPRKGELSCLMFQRSADWGLGVPFNIASYSLLCLIIAKLTGLRAAEFVHCVGNAHVYKNHVEPLREQLTRIPRPFPRVEVGDITQGTDDPKAIIERLEAKDFKLVGYDPWPIIKMDMAV